MALLAKQIWHILNFSYLLLTRTLKAKYFPNVDIFDTKIDCRPSFAWRSIMQARNVIVAGCRWKVGSGIDIKICGDKWVPRPLTSRIQSLCKILNPEARVSALIDTNMNHWDVNLINQIFWPKEAALIKSIHVGGRHCKDRLVWH